MPALRSAFTHPSLSASNRHARDTTAFKARGRSVYLRMCGNFILSALFLSGCTVGGEVNKTQASGKVDEAIGASAKKDSLVSASASARAEARAAEDEKAHSPGKMGPDAFGFLGPTGASPTSPASPAIGTPTLAGRGERSPVRVLDPNARYATTYRPGGAALAAFDSAVSKGNIPATYRDVVGDFGSRYAPAIPKPSGIVSKGLPGKGAAMGFGVDLERTSISPTGGNLHLRVAMRSADVAPERAPLSVHLVLDVSGSMEGEALTNAKNAAETLVNRLADNDDFSLVTFSDSASVLVADGLVGSRRAAILEKIRSVVSLGGTNISAGLDAAYLEAHKPGISPDAVKIVMLLSDGQANGGDTSLLGMTKRTEAAFQDGIQTSAFGLGASFDAPLMGSIAEHGAGGYYYLADSSQIAPALGRELDARLQPVATAVEVRVRLRPDVSPLKVYGSRELSAMEAAGVRGMEVAADDLAKKKDGIAKNRELDAGGGMRFFMPSFAKDDHHAMLLSVHVPTGVGTRTIGSVEIRYKDRLTKENITREIPISLTYATSDEASAATISAGVAASIQAFAAGEAVVAAAERVDAGDRSGARKILDERVELLVAAAAKLHEDGLLDDARRLGRLALAVTGTTQIADALPLALLLRGSASGYLR